MKTALITTTINVPTVLKLYRQHGPDVAMFVAGDQKSPHEAICEFAATQVKGDFLYMSPDFQADWKCSEPIGWNTIQRRNIALLEAYKFGVDIIVSVDTDDFSISRAHFPMIEHIFANKFDGIELRTENGWVDPGWLIVPETSHRGMPIRLERFYAHPAIGREIGVVASTVLGSCDLSAVDRMQGLIKRHAVSELGRYGVIVDPVESWTLFNSEAIAFRRELAPAMMVLPGVGRFDDLFASMIAQTIMAVRGMCVHLGPPAVWHERSDRGILKDLENELWGMKYILEVAAWLESIPLRGQSILQDVRDIWRTRGPLWPKTHEAALAWCDDFEELGE